MIQARILAVGAPFLAAVTLLGQLGEPVKPITPAEARKFIGTNAVVVGQVVEVHQTPKVANLNFEQKYPRQEFSAVVFEGNFGLFTNLTTFAGKTVEVSGRVTEYRGKPQIIVNSRGQMRLLEKDQK